MLNFGFICQDFLNANRRIAFFICFLVSESQTENVQESITPNAGTNEQLVIRRERKDVFFEFYHLYIGRCPAELDGHAWTEEMSKKTYDDDKSIISIDLFDRVCLISILNLKFDHSLQDDAPEEVPGP